MKLARLTDDKLQEALVKLSKQALPAKTAFKLKSLVKRVKEELGNYEELRKEALDRFGKKAENGSLLTNEDGTVQFDRPGMDSFIAHLQELVSIELDLVVLKIDELGTVVLTAEELEALDGLIVE